MFPAGIVWNLGPGRPGAPYPIRQERRVEHMATTVRDGRAERDRRIDLFRGVALLMIFVDHIPGNPLARFTMHRLGFADAAEVFVLLAGMSAAAAYVPTFRRSWGLGATRVAGRCWTLYVAHVVLFCVVAAVVATASRLSGNPLYLEQINLLPLFAETDVALANLVMLRYLPNQLDILPLYLVFLGLMPVAVPVLLRWPAALLAVSAGLWGAAQAWGWSLPNTPGDTVWFFNPFAWQLLFVLGLLAGAGWFDRVAGHPAAACLAVTCVMYALAARAPWQAVEAFQDVALLPEGLVPQPDKTDLSAWRIAHILALACLARGLGAPLGRLARSRAGLAVVLCGARSLPVFCIGTVASVLGFVVLTELGRPLWLEVTVNLVGIALLLLSAAALTWYRSHPWRKAEASGEAEGVA
jgi:hypothetical protein